MGKEEENPRSCLVSRKRLTRNQLIRFVAGPDDIIVPDLREKLPGRGAWVEAKKSVLKEAVEKQLFSRVLKQKVQAEKSLPDLVEKLLDERAVQSLGLAKKAGYLITGFAKVNSTIRSGKAALLLHASDASDDGKRKLASAVAFVKHMEGDPIFVSQCWTCDQLSEALGLGNAIHAVAINSGVTTNLIAAIEQLAMYKESAENQKYGL